MNTKDWTGNNKTTFTTLGASSHSDHERETNDYYATDSKCAIDLINTGILFEKIWENACGEGHLAKVFQERDLLARATDLIDRGYRYGDGGVDFLETNEQWYGDIVTNPPYKYAQEFCEKSIQTIQDGRYVAMFLKLTFLEGQKRKSFFKKYPPKYLYVYSQRQKCALNGNFDTTGSSAVAYAWFIWQKGFTGETIIKWI